jgi:hypothetical protein
MELIHLIVELANNPQSRVMTRRKSLRTRSGEVGEVPPPAFLSKNRVSPVIDYWCNRLT